MAAPTGASKAGAQNTKITVARFESAMLLLEELVAENTDLFIGKIHEYREKHRAGTDRALSPEEAAQVAAALSVAMTEGRDPVQVAADVQASDLRAYDQPGQTEILVAAGVSTAPAFIKAALRLVALLELPEDEFEAAYDAETLPAAIDGGVKELRKLDLAEARIRAKGALELLAEKSGAESGEGLRSLVQVVWRALNQAVQMGPGESSALSSLTGWDAPTDGAEETAFTDSQ
jgi:hypothetical protein